MTPRSVPLFVVLLIAISGCDPQVDGPQVSLDPGELNILVHPNQVGAATFGITNGGTAILGVSLAYSQDWLEIKPAVVSVVPGQTQSFTVTTHCDHGLGQWVIPVMVETNAINGAKRTLSVRVRCEREVGEPTSAIDLIVVGLEEGVYGRIFIDGPQDFEARLTQSIFIDEIYPGPYRLIAEAVEDSGIVFEPVDKEVEFEVDHEQSLEVVVEYRPRP